MKIYFLHQDENIYVYKEPGDGSIWAAQPVLFEWVKVTETSLAKPTFTVSPRERPDEPPS